MPLETATYISDLNASNPAATDGLNNADDHLRLIKATVLATFPNLTAAMNCTATELNERAAGTRTIGLGNGSNALPAMRFDSEGTLGFYRPSAGHLSATSFTRLGGNGTVPVGAICAFPKAPANFGSTVGGLTAGGYEWLELDGTVYNITAYPDLGAFLGATYGGNGTTTFAVPNAYDTGRFLRSRASTITVGTAQANWMLQHSHPGSVVVGTTDSQGSHNHGGVTGNDSPDHTHNEQSGTQAETDGKVGSVSAIGGGGNVWMGSTGTPTTQGANSRHTHTISTDGAHAHNINLGLTIATVGIGNTETRPEALAVIYAIKT